MSFTDALSLVSPQLVEPIDFGHSLKSPTDHGMSVGTVNLIQVHAITSTAPVSPIRLEEL